MKKLSLPTPATQPPLLVDIPTAARLMSTTVWAIRRLLWSKSVPYIRIGKKFLIAPADLHAYIQKQREVRAA